MITRPLFSFWILILLLVGNQLTNIFEDITYSQIPKMSDSVGIVSLDVHSSAASLSPTETLVFNLPIVEQTAPTATPIPQEIYPAPGLASQSTPGTPTPTPIPVQTGTVNLPIVFGALGIILVIFAAWFFVGFLPARKQE